MSQLYKQLKQDFRGSNAPEAQEGAKIKIFGKNFG